MENNNLDSDVIEIDLREIFAVLLHWMWLLLLSALIVGAAAFAISKFVITPTYESRTRIVILNKENNSNTITYSDLQMGTQLTKDYAELIRSRYVVEQVIQKFNLNMNYGQFVEMMNVETPSDTRIIDITIEHPDPMLAKQLVDEIRDVAAVRIEEVMDIEAVNVVDEGNLPTAPSNPNVPMWTVMGFLLGGFAAAAVVLIRFLLDDTIKSSEDVERYLHLSTLALIPITVAESEEDARRHGSRRHAVEEEDSELENTSNSTDTEGLEITDLSDAGSQA